ncbi:hypothetical protein EV200_1161 [Pedobacter psychrotolerans]|uniref:Uncharacterized protein n=1 Tax=Pedobacter psychrotolerans TaxID=1843235 RepID=A0A4R2H197_9SPHI|nr:hypothetical protein EV200_1161 [Pedobacter psychrotolerans]
MMRYLIIFGIGFLLLFKTQNVKAQNEKIKRDTIYYLLDTAAIPAKDRIFTFEREGPFKLYVLQCRCYPFFKDISFFIVRSDIKTKKLALKNLARLKLFQLHN